MRYLNPTVLTPATASAGDVRLSFTSSAMGGSGVSDYVVGFRGINSIGIAGCGNDSRSMDWNTVSLTQAGLSHAAQQLPINAIEVSIDNTKLNNSDSNRFIRRT